MAFTLPMAGYLYNGGGEWSHLIGIIIYLTQIPSSFVLLYEWYKMKEEKESNNIDKMRNINRDNHF